MNFVSMFFSAISLLGQPSELSKRYTTTIYDVEQLAITGRKVQRRRDTSIPYSPKNDLDVYKLSAQLTIINRDNLRSIGEVEGKIRHLEYEVEKARQELNTLATELDNLKDLAEQAEEYFSLLDKAERTPTEELRLKMHKAVLESNNIVNRSYYEYLNSVIVDMGQKTAPLKENFEKCSKLCELYSEIAKTYLGSTLSQFFTKFIRFLKIF